MTNNGSEWVNVIYASALSLAAVALGTLIRYSHTARRHGTKIDWTRLKYEGPAVIGLAIVAGPLSEYIHTTFGVSQGVLYATCVTLGYAGPRVFDFLGEIMEKKKDDKNDD